MSAKNWKDKVSDLRNNEKIASLLSKISYKISGLVNGTPIGASDLVGLDIGPDRIKLIKIDTTTTPYQVIDYDSIPLPAGVIVKDEIKSPAVIANALKELLRRSGRSAKFAAVAIPRTLAIIKNITIDKRLNAEEIESRAWIEANRLFPDLVGNIYLDFAVTGPSLQVPDQVDLLLVACRKEHIKPYLEIIQMSGLTPKIVDVNCYALERALQSVVHGVAKVQTLALLNVNVTQSSMIVIHNKQLIHAHDQTFDGARLMKQVDDYVNSKHGEPGMENAPIIASDSAYHGLLKENFLSHLRHAVHLFYSSRSNITIDQIVLSGDCTTIPDFATFIENEIGIKTVLADPFANMAISPLLNAAEISRLSPTLMLCSGLALSKVGE